MECKHITSWMEIVETDCCWKNIHSNTHRERKSGKNKYDMKRSEGFQKYFNDFGLAGVMRYKCVCVCVCGTDSILSILHHFYIFFLFFDGRLWIWVEFIRMEYHQKRKKKWRGKYRISHKKNGLDRLANADLGH